MPLSEVDHRAIDDVVAMLRPVRRLLVISGAGISADSGLPTYRGVGGLYTEDRPTNHGVTIEQALSGPMMAIRPDITWHYLFELERAGRGAIPNRAHRVIAKMEAHFEAAWVLTQNVDGLHRLAGSRNVIDIHGDLHELRCTRCDRRTSAADFASLALPPRCPECGAIVRPDVVLFGEELPAVKVATLWRELDRGFDVVFSVGTTSVFPYIAGPVRRARDRGIPTVEINPGRTEVSDLVGIKIGAGADEAFDQLWKRYLARDRRSGPGERRVD